MPFTRVARLLSLPLLSLTLLQALNAASAQQNAPHGAREEGSGAAQREEKLDQVLAAMAGMQRELDASKQQIDQLQNQLRDLQAHLQLAETTSSSNAPAAALEQAVQQLQGDDDVLQAEVKQHDQTKVETASKFPLRIHGLILFSSFLNQGAVDNIDLPIVAIVRTPGSTANGSLAATLRQTVIGIEGTGPSVWGAHTAADARVDFFGGVPYTGYTTSTGTLRLRTAHVHLEWPSHSLVAAFDAPLITPLQPTSYISLGEPPLSWSGNLWIWAPQFESLNERALGHGKLHYDAALIDPPTPEFPNTSGERQPNAAESSRQPGYESHFGYTIPFRDRPFTIGAAGYYSRQTYANQQHVDAWAGTADWRLPFTQWLELSGALYRGRALGGLGGGVFKDYIVYPDSGALRGLSNEGGWAQVQLSALRFVEANVMIGEDAGFSSQLRYSADFNSNDAYSNLARNRTVIANLTYRPKANFYVTGEYRNIDSWPIAGLVNTARSIGIGTGYSF